MYIVSRTSKMVAPCNALQHFPRWNTVTPQIAEKMFSLLLSFNDELSFLLLLLLLFCRCILSTDMARHNEILNKFKDILADGFSFENEVHKSMVRHSTVFNVGKN